MEGSTSHNQKTALACEAKDSTAVTGEYDLNALLTSAQIGAATLTAEISMGPPSGVLDVHDFRQLSPKPAAAPHITTHLPSAALQPPTPTCRLRHFFALALHQADIETAKSSYEECSSSLDHTVAVAVSYSRPVWGSV